MIFVLLLDGPGRIVERNKLTFLNVSTSDTQVIQCNATNKFGNRIKNAYLNVIGKCCSLMAHLHQRENTRRKFSRDLWLHDCTLVYGSGLHIKQNNSTRENELKIIRKMLRSQIFA